MPSRPVFQRAAVAAAIALLALAVGCAQQPLDESDDPLTTEEDTAVTDAGNDVSTAKDTGTKAVDAGPTAKDTEAPQDVGTKDAGPAVTDTGSEADAGTVADTGAEPDSVADTIAIADTAANPDTGAVADAGPDLDAGADAGADVPDDVPVDAGPPDVPELKPPPGKCFNNKHCDDGNACTDDACSKALKCVFVAKPEGAACEDGLPCTVDHLCAGGQCLSNPKKCSTKTQCMVAKCDNKLGGCVEVPGKPGGWCDDGNPCTSSDKCQTNGSCKGKNRKTGAACIGKTKCSTHICKEGSCIPHKSYTCNDFNQCTFDYCGIGYGNCEHKMKAHGTLCDDGIKCTSPDTCQDGTCWGKETKKGCNGLPVNTCADLKCDPKTEDANKCPIDCNPGGLKDWLLFWANCTKEVQACVKDAKCIEVGNKMVVCKHTKQVGVDWNKFKCMFDVQQKSDKTAFATYKKLSDCAVKYNFKP